MHHPGALSSLSSNHITTMLMYGEKLWLGTVEGNINIINPLTNEIEVFNAGPGNFSEILGIINHLSQVKNELWIATNAGIKKIKNAKISSLELFDRLEVKQILPENSGFVWVSHAKGIDAYDMHNDRIYHVVEPSTIMDFKYLFIGPEHNIYLIYPAEIRRYSHQLLELNSSSTIISQSKINNEICPLHSGSELAHDQNDLEIKLSVLSYRNPELNRFGTFMEGYDTAWQVFKSPVFIYQNLKPGNYIFHYKGANFTGQWGPETEISFTVLPSPWVTTWAIAGYSLILILIAVIFIILRKRNIILTRDLQVKSEELKELRKKFQEQILNNLTAEKAEGRSLQSEDIQLLQKVVDFIDTHIADDSFSVENIAQDLFMSRTKLFRRMKLITGMSPTEFIINYRLKLAAEMIKNRTGNMSEIALSVGYKNPSHFSDSFRKFHGCAPSEFQSRPDCNESKSI
jgi:AraC-like DNA-binding protein